jgi:SAM-dependent methyltransferase
MDYEEAVVKAPPGWRHFSRADVDRLPRAVRERELARVPHGEPDERVVRGLFWTLVYHLEPEWWDALARVEPITPELLDALPRDVDLAVDVGAGSGRLTEHLVARCRRVIAVEPSAGLRDILHHRLPDVHAVAGWAESLALDDSCSRLTAACGAFGPDEGILNELRRVTASGGVVALISPEQPEWFERHGWRRVTVAPARVSEHARWLDDFFGPPDPPHELVMLTV